MSDGGRLLLWLARERPPSASAGMRALSKTIAWLVPVCVIALIVGKRIITPDAPEEYEQAYPDLCAGTPAALVADAVPGGVQSDRTLDRDKSECVWTVPDDGASLRVHAGRPDMLYSDDATVERAVELYEDRLDAAEADSDDDTAEPVTGLGDEAAWYSSADGDFAVGVLVVRQGVRVVSVTLYGDGPLETIRPKAGPIAAAILPLLPAD